MHRSFNPDALSMPIAKKINQEQAALKQGGFFTSIKSDKAPSVSQQALTTPSIDLTSPAACQVAPADLALVAALAKRRAQIAALKASLIVPGHDSIATPEAHKQKPARGVFGSV